MQTEKFETALEVLIQMGRERRVAFMCARSRAVALPPFAGGRRARCAGVPVVEILSESSYRMHTLTPFARVEGLRITYPPDQAKLLW